MWAGFNFLCGVQIRPSHLKASDSYHTSLSGTAVHREDYQKKKKDIAFADSNGQKMLFHSVDGKLGQLMLSASFLQVFQ